MGPSVLFVRCTRLNHDDRPRVLTRCDVLNIPKIGGYMFEAALVTQLLSQFQIRIDPSLIDLLWVCAGDGLQSSTACVSDGCLPPQRNIRTALLPSPLENVKPKQKPASPSKLYGELFGLSQSVVAPLERR